MSHGTTHRRADSFPSAADRADHAPTGHASYGRRTVTHHDVSVTVPPAGVAAAEATIWACGPRGVAVDDSGEGTTLTASFDGEEPARRCAALLGRGAAVAPSPPVDWSLVHPDPVTVRVGDVELGLDVGPTFGWGGHATTRLALDHLAANRPVGRRVLDVGTGSGVLAIAAARLGATEVTAIDTDETAVAVATANAAANGVADRVTVSSSALDEVEGPFGLVVANLLAPELVELAPELVRVAANGTVLVSGFGADQTDAVASALAPLEVVEVGHREDWIALVLT